MLTSVKNSCLPLCQIVCYAALDEVYDEMLFLRRSVATSSYQRIDSIRKTKKPGEGTSIRGWIKNVRRLKNHIFLDVSDGSDAEKFQTVVPKTDSTKTVSAGSLISAAGVIQIAPNGSFELHAEDVNVIADGHINEYPFVPKQEHPPEYVREHLHLRSRVDYFAAMMRLRHRVQKTIHDFMDESKFIQINTPVITTNDCEGAGETFIVQPNSAAMLQEMSRKGIPVEQSYFDTKVFLSVSGQLHLEAMTHGLGDTYTFAPAFRAENSKSPLHLAEFYMFEAELAYMENMSSLTQFIENMLKQITNSVLNKSRSDVELCQRKALGNTFELLWLQKSWAQLGYDEALRVILDHKEEFKTEVRPNEGFSKEQELFLVSFCNSPVFIMDWPADLKPFYMRKVKDNPNRVHALDLLMPSVGELCGGSLRENNTEILRKQLPKGLDWYLDIRKFAGIPTGGFGMGFERYLQLLTGVKNIRDVIPFPRYPHSCKM